MGLGALAVTVLQALAGLGFVVAIGFLCEQLAPLEPNQPIGTTLLKLEILVVFTAVSVALAWLLSPAVAAIAGGLGGGWLRVNLGDSLAARSFEIFLSILIFDFFYYWLHRLQHTSWFFWQEHKLHHADLHINVTTAALHHWLEMPLRAVFISLPIVIVFDMPRSAAALAAAVVAIWAGFKHLNIRLPLGPLTPVIVGPQLHRIHHSSRPEHQDKNLAAFFPIYDLLFGTYWSPRRDEWPETGLRDREWPASLAEAGAWPFTAWWPALATRFLARKSSGAPE